MALLDRVMTSSYRQLLSLSFRGRKPDTGLQTYVVQSDHPSANGFLVIY